MGETTGAAVYRWSWTIVWVVLAAVGGALNIAAHGWSATIGIAVVVGCLCAGFHYNRPDRRGRSPHDGLLLVAGVAAVITISTAGWVTALGAGGLLLLAVAVLSWPGTYSYLASRPQIQAWRHRLEPPSADPAPRDRPATSDLGTAVTLPATPEPVAAPPVEPHAPVSTLTDEELCQAWRASFRTLEQLLVASDTARQAQLISRRQQYLDELERRHPNGFARWLASGARPAGDPSRFLQL